MNLVEVLNNFSDDINEKIESIEFDDGPDSYKLTVYAEDNELDYNHAEIILFDGGETSLYIINSREENSIYIINEILDLYLKIKSEWLGVFNG